MFGLSTSIYWENNLMWMPQYILALDVLVSGNGTTVLWITEWFLLSLSMLRCNVKMQCPYYFNESLDFISSGTTPGWQFVVISVASWRCNAIGTRSHWPFVRGIWRSPVANWNNLIMTSSNGNGFALLALCEGNSPVISGFPSRRPVTRSFDVFFHACLYKQLSK